MMTTREAMNLLKEKTVKMNGVRCYVVHDEEQAGDIRAALFQVFEGNYDAYIQYLKVRSDEDGEPVG